MKHFRQHRGARVLVQLDNGETLTGVLHAVHRDALVLVSVAAITTMGNPQPVDGLVLIEGRHITWTQVP